MAEKGKLYISTTGNGLVVRCTIPTSEMGDTKVFGGEVILTLNSHTYYRNGEFSEDWLEHTFEEMREEEIKKYEVPLDLAKIGF